MPAKQTPMFQINILLFVSLISTSKKTQSHIPIEEAYTRKQPPEMFCKKVFLEISQNSQENTSARVSFVIKLQASGDCFCTFIQKIKVRYQCQQISKITEYSKLISQVQSGALIPR